MAVSTGRTGASADRPAPTIRGGVYRASSRGPDGVSATILAQENTGTAQLRHVPHPDNKISAVASRIGHSSPVIAAALRGALAMWDCGSDLGPSPISTFILLRALPPDAGRAPPSV